MVFLREGSEKSHQGFSVGLIDLFSGLSFDYALQDIQRIENNFVVLPQKISAFHEVAPFASVCRVCSTVVSISNRVVYVQKFGLVKIRLVRLSGLLGWLNFII